MPLSLLQLVEAIQADEDKSDARSVAKRKRNLSLLHGRVGPVEVAVKAIQAVEVELSADPGVATAQILTALGFDPTKTLDLPAIIKVASPDQNRQLALLGVFGRPGDTAGADYSLFKRYYTQAPVGLDANGQPTEALWTMNDPNTHPWVSWQQGE